MANIASLLLIGSLLIFASVTPSWATPGYQKAIAQFAGVVTAVKHDEYSKAELLTRDVINQSTLGALSYYPFTTFIEEGTPTDDADYLNHLDKWISSGDTSAIAFLLRAAYYHKHGWHIRGSDYAAHTASVTVTTFSDCMRNARKDLEHFITLDTSVPYSWLLLLGTFQAEGLTPQSQEVFEQARTKYPTYYPLYFSQLMQLSPKWGGSVPKMIEFTAKYTSDLPEGSGLRILPIALYKFLVWDMTINCSASLDDAHKAACIKALSDFLRGTWMRDRLKAAFGAHSHIDPFEYNQVVFGSLLNSQLLFKSDFTEIYDYARTEVGPDNYALNTVLGHLAASTHEYSDAAQYYTRALQGMNAFSFPTLEDKNSQMGEVYGRRADLELRQNQVAESLQDANKAIELDNTNPSTLVLRCKIYTRMKQLPAALNDCNEALRFGYDAEAARFQKGIVGALNFQASHK